MISQKSLYSTFSLFHVNARSLYKNIYNLTDYLKDINFIFSVIAISETWANETNSYHLALPGYNAVVVCAEQLAASEETLTMAQLTNV